MTKAPEGPQDSWEWTDRRGSRAYLETQAAKGTRDPQGSWDPEDPRVLWACLAQMDCRAPAAFQALQGPLGTGAFQERCWGPSPGPGEMPGYLDTPGRKASPGNKEPLDSKGARGCPECQGSRASWVSQDPRDSRDCPDFQDGTDSQELPAQRGPWGCPVSREVKVCPGTGVTLGTPVPRDPWA